MKDVHRYLFGKMTAMLLCLASVAYAAAPGAPDLSFGTAGYREIALPSTSLIGPLQSVVLENGGILVGAQLKSTANVTNGGVIKFRDDGSIDSQFGTNGVVQIPNVPISGICVQADGKILLVGTNLGNSTGFIRRLNPNGSTDTTFADSGSLDLGIYQATRVLVQVDGRIVIAGSVAVTGGTDAFLMRLTATGGLDLSFGGGIQTSGLAGTEVAFAVKLQPDGKIVTAGVTTTTESTAFVLRHNSNGTFDTTFDGDGIAFQNRGTGADANFDVHVNDDGRLLLFGQTGFQTIVQRLLANGAPDNSYNGDSVFFISGSEERQAGLVVQAPGRVIIFEYADSQQRIHRLDASGNPDPTFGTNGIVATLNGARDNMTEFVLALTPGERLLTLSGSFDRPAMEMRRFHLNRSDSQSSDFDGDGFGDIAVYRPSAGMWFVLRSTNGTVIFKQFGLNGDVPLDGDFDGDARTDFAIFRPSNGLWFVESSREGTNFARIFGNSTDRPVVNDYDRDGRTDIAVFRPTSGEWFFLRSTSGFNEFNSFAFGQNGDIPIGKAGL